MPRNNRKERDHSETAVTGAGLMRSGVLPAWAGALLALTSLLLLAFNDQNERILVVIPFGVSWMVLGGLLWFAAASPASRWHARIQMHDARYENR